MFIHIYHPALGFNFKELFKCGFENENNLLDPTIGVDNSANGNRMKNQAGTKRFYYSISQAITREQAGKLETLSAPTFEMC